MAGPLLDFFRLPGGHGRHLSWMSFSDLINISIAVVALVLSFTRWFARRWQPTVWVMAVAIAITSTLVGTLGNDQNYVLIALILMIVGTGSLLPWSSRMQASFNLVCLACWSLRNVWTPAAHVAGFNDLVIVAIAASLAQVSCFLRNRYMREQEASATRTQQSEAALRQIFDANTDAISLFDLQTRQIVDVNLQFILQTGYRPEEAIGKTARDLGIWADPKAEQFFVRELAAGRPVRNMEADIRLKDGSTIPCMVSSAVVMIKGRPAVMTNARDVTDLKKSRARLEESEAPCAGSSRPASTRWRSPKSRPASASTSTRNSRDLPGTAARNSAEISSATSDYWMTPISNNLKIP